MDLEMALQLGLVLFLLLGFGYGSGLPWEPIFYSGKPIFLGSWGCHRIDWYFCTILRFFLGNSGLRSK